MMERRITINGGRQRLADGLRALADAIEQDGNAGATFPGDGVSNLRLIFDGEVDLSAPGDPEEPMVVDYEEDR